MFKLLIKKLEKLSDRDPIFYTKFDNSFLNEFNN